MGGFEIGGLAGIILGAAARRCPVVLDGLIATAAALLAVGLVPAVRDYLIAGHRSVEPGHTVALHALGLEPVLDLELRLGEGTGGVLALPVLEAACRLLDEMATFEEAGVATDDPAPPANGRCRIVTYAPFGSGLSVPHDHSLAAIRGAATRGSGWPRWHGIPSLAQRWEASWWACISIGSAVFPDGVLRPMLVVLLVILSGGLHLDGFADVCDGFYAGRTKADALRIMKDPHLGTMAVIGIVSVLIMKVVLLSYLPAAVLGSALLIFPAISRGGMVWGMWMAPYARPEGGTGETFFRTLAGRHVWTATILLSVWALLCAGWPAVIVLLCARGSHKNICRILQPTYRRHDRRYSRGVE